MKSFIISHHSELISCLVAAAIKLYYGNNVKILILHFFDPAYIRPQAMPWCGNYTLLTSGRSMHWDFLHSRLLCNILVPGMVFLDMIRMNYYPANSSFNPELPVWNQRSKVTARATTVALHTSIFYHPLHILRILKLYLLESPHVSFASVMSQAALSSAIDKCDKESTWINFITDVNNESFAACEMLVHSRLSAVDMNGKTFSRRSHASPQMPRTVLWLPSFKALAQIPNEVTIRSEKRIHGSFQTIGIYQEYGSPTANAISLKYDLVHGLKVCGFVLDCINDTPYLPSKL